MQNLECKKFKFIFHNIAAWIFESFLDDQGKGVWLQARTETSFFYPQGLDRLRGPPSLPLHEEWGYFPMG